MQQSASQLTYRLQRGPTDLLPLRILASRETQWLDWSVRICVLGASHAVEFSRPGACLTELLTCSGANCAAGAALAMRGDAPVQDCVVAEGLSCRVRLIPFSLVDGDMLQTPFPTEDRMDVAFPCERGIAPITRVGWTRIGLSLLVETVHTYPEEGRGVRSISLFVSQDSAE